MHLDPHCETQRCWTDLCCSRVISSYFLIPAADFLRKEKKRRGQMSVFIIFIFGNLWIKQPSFYSASRLLLHCWGFVGLPVCVWIGRDSVEPSKVTQNGGENTKSPERSPAASQEPADWCSQSSTSGTRRKNVKNTSLYQDIHSSIDRSAIHSFIQSSIIYSSIIHPLIIFIYPSFFPSSSI